ncbi:hypothetical protein, partial [Ardenticatena maritima]|uniref:hypothetical protein n=1 Tax=Ardenticatena maritima TaxID=872965 RepID=UPI001F461D37
IFFIFEAVSPKKRSFVKEGKPPAILSVFLDKSNNAKVTFGYKNRQHVFQKGLSGNGAARFLHAPRRRSSTWVSGKPAPIGTYPPVPPPL